MSETSEYSYELCGPDPTEDLYWLRQRGRPVIRRSAVTSAERFVRSQSSWRSIAVVRQLN